MTIEIGFTGSQKGTTSKQQTALRDLFMQAAEYGEYDTIFHHGDCVGADDDAAHLAYALGFELHAWPQNTNPRTRANTKKQFPSTTVHRARPPLERNKVIAERVDVLVACPSGPEERRSGTWATIRYALKLWEDHRELTVHIVWPDGRVDTYPSDADTSPSEREDSDDAEE